MAWSISLRKVAIGITVLIFFTYCALFGNTVRCQTANNVKSADENSEIDATVRGLLESNRSQDRAWGAYLIGSEGRKDLSPLLYKILEHQSQDLSSEDTLVFHCALDSLIQMGQSIPAKLINPLFIRFPNEILILASRSAKENQGALLGLLMEDRSDLQWFAVSNILSKEKTPGFASLLVRGIEIKASASVVDTLIHGGYGEGSDIGCGSSCGFGARLLDGYPPIGMYRIDDKADQQNGMVSDGRHPIFYQRRLVAAGDSFGNSSRCESKWSRNESRLGYLSDMLGIETSALEIDLNEFFTIEWHDAKQFQSEMARHKKGVELTYWNLVVSLVENKLLSTDDANTLRPNLSIRVFDLRADKSVPLPKVRWDSK